MHHTPAHVPQKFVERGKFGFGEVHANTPGLCANSVFKAAGPNLSHCVVYTSFSEALQRGRRERGLGTITGVGDCGEPEHHSICIAFGGLVQDVVAMRRILPLPLEGFPRHRHVDGLIKTARGGPQEKNLASSRLTKPTPSWRAARSMASLYARVSGGVWKVAAGQEVTKQPGGISMVESSHTEAAPPARSEVARRARALLKLPSCCCTGRPLRRRKRIDHCPKESST